MVEKNEGGGDLINSLRRIVLSFPVFFFFSFSLTRGQREAGYSSDVRYHPVSSTRLHTGTREPVPLPLLFPSALFEPAQEHPKAALDFYRTKTVTAAPRHYKTGVHLWCYVRTRCAQGRIVFFYELAGRLRLTD